MHLGETTGGGGHSCRGPGERKADQLKGTSPHCRGPVIIPVMGADSTPYIPSLQGASDKLEALSQQWELAVSLFGVSLSRSTNKETRNFYSLRLIHIYIFEMMRGRLRRSAAERRYLPADCRLENLFTCPRQCPFLWISWTKTSRHRLRLRTLKRVQPGNIGTGMLDSLPTGQQLHFVCSLRNSCEFMITSTTPTRLTINLRLMLVPALSALGCRRHFL